MNGTYYPNPTFPSNNINNYQETSVSIENELPFEQRNIENILKLNNGKKITIYTNYTNQDINHEGILEQAGKDNIIISIPETGKWILIPTKYINYIEFDEKVNIIN